MISATAASLLLLVCHASASSAAAGSGVPATLTAQQVLDWIDNAANGYFNPKQELRFLENSTQSSVGIFAKEDIAKDEILLEVPWDLTIKSKDQTEEGQMCCGTVQAVLEEMQLGKESKYHPYSTYLQEQSFDELLPSSWSQKGKDLLYTIIGHPHGSDPRTVDFDTIPPEEPVEWLEIDYYRRCQGSKRDIMASKAALLVVQRSDDYIMVPGYDLYNHRNGKWHNTHITWDRDQPHITKASRNIKKGEQIYNSYNFCAECTGRVNKYGAAEILRDYGFVEEYPQRWYYQSLGGAIQFDIDINTHSNKVEIVSFPEKFIPRDEYMGYTKVWVHRQIRKQRRIQNLHFHKSKWPTIPDREWQIIWDFHKGNVLALELAREHLHKIAPPRNSGEAKEQQVISYEEGSHPHYDLLEYETDDLDYISPTCDNEQVMMFDDFVLWESLKTNYQPVGFEYNAQTDDVCMDIDNIVQICSSYRPQYHEFVTHYAARFVKDVKRILFVGGGDSMLLYEALKYPTLELVVGLELDQTVARKSFKYFQTQPHFDDERVEWWFGDATKSLLLLPEEYWGSFDLVLVDLSETVMSLSVTKELDVFDALALLLNPDGVIVKNELYLEHFSRVFDYTIQILYDSPIICSQVVALGSNRVDFLHDAAKDHGIPNLLYTPLTKPDNRFDLVHDYRKNDARAQGKCGKTTPPIDTSVQESSSGILEIVNAENVSIGLDDSASIVKMIQSIAKKQGFTVGPSKSYSGGLVVVVLKEGYIAARLWPEHNYVGFDIHLWGMTFNIKSLKNALTTAVKSSLVSAYKVVVGGMFGSSSWKEDQLKIGPYSKTVADMNRNCEEKAVVANAKPISIEIIEIAINETFSLLDASPGLVVGVVCGVAGEDCLSSKMAKSHPAVESTVEFHSCPDLKDEAAMYECEKLLLPQFEQAMVNGPFDMLMVDNGAPYEMLQILNSLLDVDDHRETWLSPVNIVVAFSTSPQDETWRKYFLDRYRIQYGDDPVARAEFVLDHEGDDTVEIGLVLCGDELYVYNLEAVEHNMRKRLSVNHTTGVELRTINAGLFPYSYDFEPTTFEQKEYDNEPGLKQFAEQQPLGRQNIFQMVSTKEEVELTALGLFHILKQSLLSAGYDASGGRFEKAENVGDGGMIVYASTIANVILVWDGRSHVDISFFTFEEGRFEKKGGGVPEKFIKGFLKHSKHILRVNLRDDQPRGIGRVINFPSDLEPAKEEEEEDDDDDDEEWQGTEEVEETFEAEL